MYLLYIYIYNKCVMSLMCMIYGHQLLEYRAIGQVSMSLVLKFLSILGSNIKSCKNITLLVFNSIFFLVEIFGYFA